MNLHQISKIVVFAFSLLLLFVLPGCLFDHPPETEPPVATSALTLEYPDGSTQTNATQGETIKVKIKFKIGFNDDGKTILVSLSTAQQGLTFDGVTTPLSLHGAIGTVVTAEANVKVAANAVAGIRTIKAKVDDRSDDSAALLDVLDNLVSVTITPASSNIPLGGSKDYVLSILPRGGTVGPIVLTTAVQRAGVSVSPKTFAPVMLFHSLTPVLQTVTVSAATAALLGTGDLNISYHGEI